MLNHRGSPWAVRWFLVNEMKLSRSYQSLRAAAPSPPASVADSPRDDGRALEKSIAIASGVLSLISSSVVLFAIWRGNIKF